MHSNPLTLLYFGDQTDDWVDGIDQLYKQAISTPWLQSLLDDLVRVVKEESIGMDHVLRDSMGDYSSLLDIAERYRHTTDEVGMARAILLHTVRSAMLLLWVEREPQLVSTTGPSPERLGISGGLTNLCALAIATDFRSLYQAVLDVARLFVRLCRFTSVRSRAMEDRPGKWGWAVLGITPDELTRVLEQFQESMGIPSIKRAKIGVTGDRWSTVIGPPSVLDLVINQCSALRNLPKNPLSIHALQHVVTVSQTDLDYIVGDSALLKKPILTDFRVWGMDDPKATYTDWGCLLRAVVRQVLSLPLDITKVIDQTKSWLGRRQLDVKVIGPSSHTPYLASVLEKAGCKVSVQSDRLLDQHDQPNSGRVAIVGMAGRGPGSENLEEFWDVIMSKQDLCEEIPKDRFDIDEFYCTEHKDTCTTTTRFGCFMKKPGNFDPRFFKVSPREALLMDPGHRQFLMSTYEALEMAGYSNGQTTAIDPRKIAAFYGQSNDDWHMVSHYTLGCDAYTLQGAQRAFGAGRAAFHFKWEGPTYSLDSACASSSSATHLACLSLLAKDIDMAVVGAANIVGYPHSWTSLSKSGVLSDTGNCKTYRDDADGYCRADFVGSVVLKRLEDAVAQNDNILAVVAGSGRNHSGNSTSITTSDAGAQERLFRKVMQSARVSPNDISYVEMHGTGTQIGDPAEMGAIASIFKHRKARQHLTVGGVKANIGHSEAAAGMASLLKCIMMFQKNIMPPQAGMPHALNPKYPSLSELKIDIPSEPKEFTAIDQKPRRILLNNFDAAGGNACLLLEDHAADCKEGVDPRLGHVVVTSAKSQASLLANKRNLLEWLRANSDVNIRDVAYTTTARRMHHPVRFACTASTTQELIGKLEQDLIDLTPSQASQASPIVYTFTGQGSHYAGMGSGLYATCRAFRETVDLCTSICEVNEFPPFLDIITNKDIDITRKNAVQTQLAVVTLEVALASFWRSCGLLPSMVVGHSLGEYAALHVAGVLSIADMLYLVGHRARLILERCEAGACAMLAIPASSDSIQRLLETKTQSSCTVACVNSPTNTVVSGSIDDIADLKSTLTTPSTSLAIPFGFHSSQMDPMIDDYVSLAGGVTYSAPKVPVVSTLLASIVESQGIFNANYLGQQTRHPVDFMGAINMVRSKHASPLWIEVGPGRVCSGFIRATLGPTANKLVSSLEANTDPWLSISTCLTSAYENGTAIDWLAFHAPFDKGLKLLTLPSYAWDLKDFWITYTETNEVSRNSAPAHESEIRISTCAQYVVHESRSPVLQATLRASVASMDFMALFDGHRIRGVSIVPGSVFCDAGLAAVSYVLQSHERKESTRTRLSIKDMSLKRPLTRDLVGTAGELLTSVESDAPSNDRFRVTWKASTNSLFQELGSCLVTIMDAGKLQANWNQISYFACTRMHGLVRDVKNGHGHRMLPSILYAMFSNTVEYDAAFKTIKEAFISANFDEAVAEVILVEDPKDTRFVASPYWGESLVHLAGFLVNANPGRPNVNSTFMMDSFEKFEQSVDFLPGKSYFTYARVSTRKKDTTTCDVYVFDSDELVMQCSGLRFHEVSNNVLDRILGNHANGSQIQRIGTTAATTSPEQQSKAQRLTSEKPKPSLRAQLEDREEMPKVFEPKNPPPETDTGPKLEAFDVILESIAKGTGTNVSDLTDDTILAELGVDSIMGIEIAARANSSTGLDILPSFMIDYPTVGNLRTAFGQSQGTPPYSDDTSDYSLVGSGPQSTSGSSTTSINNMKTNADRTKKGQNAASDVEEDMVMIDTPVEDDSPAPATRVTLLQGRPSNGKPPFYLIADGTGSIATYIHLPPFKTKRPVYGLDSPYLRCPRRLSTKVGIVGAAKIIVEALLKFQKEGNFSIGGFSGGAMLSYEVCRQLAATGRSVDSLMIIDMCCPRPSGAEDKAEIGWKVYESIALQGGSWNASIATQQHLRAIFASVASYHPPPMTPAERPKRTAIIWAKKGLIDRCSGDLELMKLLAESNIPTKPFAGFMEDPRMGAIAWGLPHKTDTDLGPNGWEKYVGETLCLSIEADHLEMPMPGHVNLLHGAMEEAFTYLSGN